MRCICKRKGHFGKRNLPNIQTHVLSYMRTLEQRKKTEDHKIRSMRMSKSDDVKPRDDLTSKTLSGSPEPPTPTPIPAVKEEVRQCFPY